MNRQMAADRPNARRPQSNELRFPILLRQLSGRSLALLARHSEILELPSGSRVVQREGRRKHLLFALKGEIHIKGSDGLEETVQGGTTRSHFPLIADKTAQAECRCTQASLLLRIPISLLKQVRSEDPNTASANDSLKVEEDRLEDRIYLDFNKAVKDGTLKLPGMPDVAVRIARHIDAPESTSESIARIIQMDPSITARLIQVANSPAFGGRVRIETCEDAVTRLGNNTTRELVTSFVLKGVFRTRHGVLKTHMHDLWVHSTQVAAICHALAKRTPGFDPAQALLMGLVHDIGVIPLLSEAHRYSGLADNVELLERIIRHLRGDFSAMTLRKWGFAAEFVVAAREAENWFRNHKPEVEYADILLIAQLHAFVGTRHMTELPRLDEVPAFKKLALGELSPRMSLLVLDEAKSEIEQVRQLIA